jgi:hypothetical protein
MFFIANTLLVASVYCYSQYMDAMATVHAIGEIQFDEPKELTIMEYRDKRIDNFSKFQERLWIAGMVATGLTLLSAHLFKRPSTEADKS